jgi:hypothetical protein
VLVVLFAPFGTLTAPFSTVWLKNMAFSLAFQIDRNGADMGSFLV